MLSRLPSYVIASMLLTQLLFAEDACAPKCKPTPCPQPKPPTQMCGQDPCCPPWFTPLLHAAYNYPARPQLRCPWDISFDASFTYWQAIQENMELGLADTLIPGSVDGVLGPIVNMNFDFKPGFILGINGYFGHDNWDTRAEYTWFHISNRQNVTVNGTTIQALLTMWGNPGVNPIGGGNFYNIINEDWGMRMDIADLDLGRACYIGTDLKFRPYAGVRAAWIRQDVTVVNTNNGGNGHFGLEDIWTVSQKSRSWAVGAKGGLDTTWTIGSGFRVLANIETDLLFTKYTSLSFSALHNGLAASNNFGATQDRLYSIRPHTDLELGLGWGTYLFCNKWYLDMYATYGYQVFFNQNMFRHYNDDVMDASSTSPNGNLYIHGLTATFRLDF